MKIKKAYIMTSLPGQIILETKDGFFITDSAPYRKIKKSDLRKSTGFFPYGNNAESLPDYMMAIYGLEV